MRALVLFVVAVLVALAYSCGDPPPPKIASGPELFERELCVRCHGKSGEGTSLGPALHGKKVNWTREALVAYLKEPQLVAKKDPRLAEQGRKFLQPMPSYKLLLPEELDRLAEHVLAIP